MEAQTDSPKEARLGCPRKSYLSRLNSLTTSDSDGSLNQSGLDILANIASPKHQRVDSFSNISLPDEMRISFSESEDVSFQLDDVDFSYSPSTDVDLSGANIVSVDTNSDLNEDKDLRSVQDSISSTSGLKNGLSVKNKIDSPQEDVPSGNVKRRKGNKKSSTYSQDFLYSYENENQLKEGVKEGALDDKAWNQNAQAHQVSTVGSSGEVLDKKLVSPRRSNKVKHMVNVPCQVCGDVAAGFYCGAYICEACKKFYMRAYKLDKMKYVCLRDKNCVITKESRVQCQYCRFQKCLSLNMYFPKQGEGESNKEATMSEIPCRVCSAPSSGFHFGAITCEGCKGFFRRMAKEREPERYHCTKKGNCEINMLTRNLCKACRYQQCLKAGMSIEASRIGRQPNSVKHLITMEVKNKMKTEPGAENSVPNDSGTSTLYFPIKEEPPEFLESPCDKYNFSANTSPFDDSDKDNSTIQTNGDVIFTGVSNQSSASGQIHAQPSYNSALNTSSNETRNSTVLKDLSTVQQYHSQNVSKDPPVSLSDYIPPVNVSTVCTNQTILNPDTALTVPGRVPSVSSVGRSQTNTLECKIPAAWNSQRPQSLGYRKDPIQSNTNVGTIHSLSPSPDKPHMSPSLSPNMGNQSKSWQNGSSNERTNQEYGVFSFTTDQNKMSAKKKSLEYSDAKTGRQTEFNQKGPRVMQDTGNSTESWNQLYLKQQQQYQNNNKYTPQSQPELQVNVRPSSKISTPTSNIGSELSLSSQSMYTGKSNRKMSNLESDRTLDLPLGSIGIDKHGEEMEKNESVMDTPEFIRTVIEAGKCLQLLNYRVFDTDLNPTASMNVDEIKTLFKTKNVDPRAGNRITSSVNMAMFASKESTWSYMMTNFHHNTYITIRFAKMVPGFKTLSLNDQVKLIQTSIYPIELLNMSKVYDPVTKQYNYFTYTKEEENIMMEHFPMLRVFQEHFLHVGEMVSTFNLTDEEFALLSALLLFPAEISGLENPKAVEDLQNRVTDALQYYEERRAPDGLTRFGILLVRVAELIQCLLQHNLAIGLLLTHNPTIRVPQLFHELIIESIKEGQR